MRSSTYPLLPNTGRRVKTTHQTSPSRSSSLRKSRSFNRGLRQCCAMTGFKLRRCRILRLRCVCAQLFCVPKSTPSRKYENRAPHFKRRHIWSKLYYSEGFGNRGRQEGESRSHFDDNRVVYIIDVCV